MKSLNLSLVFILFFVVSCIRIFHADRLIGEYYLNNGFNNDRITVRKDFTYTHRYVTKFGVVYESSGTWSYDNSYGEIVFDKFIFYHEGGSTNLPDGIWASHVDVKWSGEVRFNYSRENRIYYTKTETND